MSLLAFRIYVYSEVLERIRTNIIYFSASRSHPMPSGRREAYESGGLLPSPMDDPEGWLSWPTLTICGAVDPDTKPRNTKVGCMVCVLCNHLTCQLDGSE